MSEWAQNIRKAVLESNREFKQKGYAMDPEHWYTIADFIEKREKEGKDDIQIFGELVEMIGNREE